VAVADQRPSIVVLPVCEAVAFTVRSHELVQEALKLGEDQVADIWHLHSNGPPALRFAQSLVFHPIVIAILSCRDFESLFPTRVLADGDAGAVGN